MPRKPATPDTDRADVELPRPFCASPDCYRCVERTRAILRAAVRPRTRGRRRA